MRKRTKRQMERAISLAFEKVEKNKYFKWVESLPYSIRIIIFIVLTIIGIVGIFTPIPAVLVFLFGFAILFGIQPVKRILIRSMYFLRIPRLVQKYKEWRIGRRRKSTRKQEKKSSEEK